MQKQPALLVSVVSLLAALGALGAPTSALAQSGASLMNGRGMDLHLFRPAVDSKGILTVNGTDVLGHLDFSFGLVLDGGFAIAPFSGFVNDPSVASQDAERTSTLVDAFFTGTIQANLGLGNLAIVGVQIPIQVVNGPNQSIPGIYNAGDADGSGGLDYQGLGGLTIHGKVRLTRVERDPIGVAAILHVELPTGSPSEMAGDGFALWPVLALELRPVREVRLALNAGYRLNFTDGATIPIGGRTVPGMSLTNAVGAMFDPAVPGTNVTYDDLITFGAGASFRVADPIELAIEAYGTQSIASFNEHGTSVEAIAGLKIFVERSSYLVLGGGIGIPNAFSDGGGFQSADVRGMLGFVFEPSIGDRDGDGLKDDFDQCPDEPEDFDSFADEDGCPDPDNDRDGILDVDDECPMIPEDRDGDADHDGCPEGNRGDRDGDGLLDEVDGCPDDPEDLDGFQDEDGCPDPDNDRDGILDTDDLCPNDPEDRDSFEDEDGCPDPDNDQDRILDVNDSCPNDPEEYNNFEDEDGCPDQGVLRVDDGGFVLFEQIHFQTDSARILEESYPILDAIAAAMAGHPEIHLVEIQGHADERSSDEYNIELTRDRAAAVREGLVQRGVVASRMRSAGYGERCPEDPRHTQAAWEKNRRVVIKILETDDGPTNVEIACPAGRELIPR